MFIEMALTFGLVSVVLGTARAHRAWGRSPPSPWAATSPPPPCGWPAVRRLDGPGAPSARTSWGDLGPIRSTSSDRLRRSARGRPGVPAARSRWPQDSQRSRSGRAGRGNRQFKALGIASAPFFQHPRATFSASHRRPPHGRSQPLQGRRRLQPSVVRTGAEYLQGCGTRRGGCAERRKIIVLPELGMSGGAYPGLEAWLPHGQCAGKATDAFSEVTKKYRCYVAIGLAELDPETRVTYNPPRSSGRRATSAPQERHQHGRRHHFPAWEPATGLPDRVRGNITMLICYDDTYWDGARVAVLKVPTSSATASPARARARLRRGSRSSMRSTARLSPQDGINPPGMVSR